MPSTFISTFGLHSKRTHSCVGGISFGDPTKIPTLSPKLYYPNQQISKNGHAEIHIFFVLLVLLTVEKFCDICSLSNKWKFSEKVDVISLALG